MERHAVALQQTVVDVREEPPRGTHDAGRDLGDLDPPVAGGRHHRRGVTGAQADRQGAAAPRLMEDRDGGEGDLGADLAAVTALELAVGQQHA